MSTNNEKRKLNLIPLFILVGVALIGYFVFIKDKDIFNMDKKPEVRRLNGFPTTVYTDKEFEKDRQVITSQEQLNQFLNFIDDSGYVILRENIDFDKEFVLAASSSTYSETGHGITIKKLYEDTEKNSLLVSIKETDPGDTCQVEPASYISVDLVTITKTDKTINFERVKEIEECD